MHSLLDLGEVIPIFGAYYGLLLQSQIWGGYKIFGAPNKCNLLKAVARGLIAVLIGAPFLAISLISTDQIPNIYALYFVARVIPFLIGFFLIFGVVDTLCLKISLYVYAGAPLLTESQVIHSELDLNLD